jgi:hypothetical protein
MNSPVPFEVAAAALTKAVDRSIQIVAFGLNASTRHSVIDRSVPGAGIQLVIGKQIPTRQIRSAFRSWTLASGLRDCVDALSLALEAARVEGFLWVQPGTVSRRLDGALQLQAQIPVEIWNRQLVGARRVFDRLTLPRKMKTIEERFGIERPVLADDILSINVARNCLTHRLGTVGEEDVDSDKDFMTVRWRRWRLRVNEDGIERDIKIGQRLEKGGAVSIELVKRSRRFRVGRKISLSASDFVEIATTFVFYGNQLQENIKRMQEMRFAAQSASGASGE